MTASTSNDGGDGEWPRPGSQTFEFGVDDHAQSLIHCALKAGGAAAWFTNLSTHERWWSASMFAMHGLTDAADTPGDYMTLVHPEDREIVAAAFRHSVTTGSHKVEYRVVWPDGSCHWIEGTGRTAREPGTNALTISGICTLLDTRKQQEADLRFLSLASAELARSTDYEETLRRVATLAVPHFADWCAVDMLDANGELRRVAVAHVDPAKVDLARDLYRRYPPERDAAVGTWNVIRTGQSECLAEVTDDVLAASARDADHLAIVRSLGLRSYMGVPIVGAGGRILGAVTFVTAETSRLYGPRDLDLASDLVSRAAVAIQNAELFQTLQHSHARQGLLLKLTDILRAPGETADVLKRVCELLGGHFGVDRVGYGHVDEGIDRIDYDVCWTDGSVPPLLGTFPASAFGQKVIDRLLAGETIAIGNVREHPFTSDQAALKTSHEVETRAILVVPLFKAGQLRTIVYLNQGPERAWTGEEISLMEEVAERTRELIERGRAEHALRASEARWRGLFEVMAEGFYTGEVIRDANGQVHDFRFLQVNPAFERLTGVAPEHAMGRPVSEVIPGLQRDLIEAYARVVDTGEPAEFEVEVPALNHRWYEARASRIAQDQFSVLFIEITNRKLAQMEAVRSAERYRTLFESIDEGFCILEVQFDSQERPADYRFLEINPAFERQGGMTNAVGRSVRELVPDIEAHWIEAYGKVALTGESIRFENHAQSLGRWFDVFAFRVGDPRLRRVALLFTDITERKRAQDALIQREVELREAQQLACIGSWTWDPLTDCSESSPELLRIFGYPAGSRMPNFQAQRGTLYPEEEWDRLHAAVKATLDGKGPYSVDLRAFRQGEPIWVITRGSAVHDASGRLVGLRGTVQDITERKQIEQALRAADERKNEFLATLAHELRNPLAPLRTGLAILDRAGSMDSRSVRTREMMERQLTHLVRLVDDLLDVSRVSQGKVVLKKSVHSLQSVVDLAMETARPLLDAAGHQLRVDLPRDPVLLTVDATRIAQVLSNILNNAARYTPTGGRIRLRGEYASPGRVRLQVEDNGVGIPADMLEGVFDLFMQVGEASGHSYGGLGIGLSLARRLVELHGGTVRASSPGLGQGSTFTVELPAMPPLREPEPSSSRLNGRLAPEVVKKSVLVVDDNVDAATSLAMLLEMEGHEVRVVNTGRDALNALAGDYGPDIVFLDIGLPDLSGYEVATELRRRPAMNDTLIVALTGWGAERDQQLARISGFDRHLTKPVSTAELTRVLFTECEPRPAPTGPADSA